MVPLENKGGLGTHRVFAFWVLVCVCYLEDRNGGMEVLGIERAALPDVTCTTGPWST